MVRERELREMVWSQHKLELACACSWLSNRQYRDSAILFSGKSHTFAR